MTYLGVRFNAAQASRQPWSLTNHLKDLGHEIRQQSAIFGYLRSTLFKLSYKNLRMLLSRWILGKIRFSNPMLAECKTHDEEYAISFRASLRHLNGMHKSCPNRISYDPYGYFPLFYERNARERASALNRSHSVARLHGHFRLG